MADKEIAPKGDIKPQPITPFAGKRTDARTFIDSLEDLFAINPHNYEGNDERKIRYTLACLGPELNDWKVIIRDELSATGGLDWKNFTAFRTRFIADWGEVNSAVRALNNLANLRVGGNISVPEYIRKFRVDIGTSGLTGLTAQLQAFVKGLPSSIAEKVLEGLSGYTTMTDVYTKAENLHNAWETMRLIGKRTGSDSRPNFRRNDRSGPSRTIGALPFGKLSDEQKEEYRKTGKCFRCGIQGHISRDCPKRKDTASFRPSYQGKAIRSVTEETTEKEPELDAKRIRAMIKAMPNDERLDMFNKLEEEGF